MTPVTLNLGSILILIHTSVIKGTPQAHFMQGATLCVLPSHKRRCWLRRTPRHGGTRFVEAQRRAPEEIELRNLITHPMREQRKVR